ncbi:MAG: ribose 5-phosphate isomerase B [Chitinophagales bacterium]|nr:ribose 5-phosphate isomerase B [Bacteroidota bacterium]MCB9042197.1 ribose 5-phosphate isomerase B [Chitinophagales bacterium]
MTSTLPIIAVGSDHAGFAYKNNTCIFLNELGYEVIDFGTFSTDSVDYPDFAHPLAEAIENGEAALGFLFCGSANGVAITANKHQAIRAAISWMPELAQLARQHNDANVLCIPARFVAWELAQTMMTTFLNTSFEAGRHATRVGKIGCG